jgi:MATE family multidrug resistance protein
MVKWKHLLFSFIETPALPMFNPPNWLKDAKVTLALAWPIALAHGTNVMTAVLDTVMVGHTTANELAYLSLGRGLAYMAITICFGLLSGVMVKVSQANGAKNYPLAGQYWRSGLVLGLCVGTLGALLAFLAGSVILQTLSLSPALIKGAMAFLAVRVCGIPAMIGVYTCTGFLEGIKRPKQVMTVVLCMVGINMGINYLLIGGNLGFPALGATGAAVGTTVAEWCSLLIFTTLLRKGKRFALFELSPFKQSFQTLKARALDLLRFGVPFAFSNGLEMGAFATLGLMAGRLGALNSATHEVFWSINLVGFALIIGLSSATAVRVGNAIGAKETAIIPNLVGNSLLIACLAMGLVSLPLFLLPVGVMHIFTTSSVVVGMGMGLLPLMAFVLLGDTLQFTLMASLRACNDQWKASALQILGFWVVLVPLAYYLTFQQHWGLKGLMVGWMAGVFCVGISLGLRFLRLAAKLKALPTGFIDESFITTDPLPLEDPLIACQEP